MAAKKHAGEQGAATPILNGPYEEPRFHYAAARSEFGRAKAWLEALRRQVIAVEDWTTCAC